MSRDRDRPCLPECPCGGSVVPPEVWTMGEMLVEIMRPRAGMKLGDAGA